MSLSGITHWWIQKNPARFDELHQNLISIRFGKTLIQYITYALLISGIGALFGLFFGFFTQYFVALFSSEMLAFFNVQIDTILLRIVLFLLFPAFWAWIFYRAVLFYPHIERYSRGARITAGLHNVVAFMYAIRKGGAEMLDIFRMISAQTDVYGDIAQEFRHIVRDCDVFGDDLITAVRERALTTASVKCKEFLQDLLSIIEGGGNLTVFLEDRVDRFHEEAVFEQKQFLLFLGMVGEIYITTFIAGPLFLIVIMVVMGMMGASAVFELSAIAYIVLPLGSVLFLVMIDMLAIKDSQIIRVKKEDALPEYKDVRIERKGDEMWFRSQLARYDKIKSLFGWLFDPLRGVMEQPSRILYLSVPLGLISLFPVFLYTPLVYSEAMIHAFDSRVAIAYLIAVVPFVYFYEKRKKELHAIEEKIPEFLDRMAGLNAVGITLTQSIGILSRSNLGVLKTEIRYMERDISWGSTFGEALGRFGDRIHTVFMARAVTLVSVASTMNSNIAEILRIAAKDTKMAITLRRDRFGEMFLYTAVVYLAYFVFLGVLIIISTQFLSVIAEQAGAGSSFGMLSGVGEISLKTINRLLYHICLIQSICSGLVAGFMGEESIYSGLKHGCIMLVLSLLCFYLIF
ncbi:MAG: type II secretion system F family protein [Methanomicrobiales archaeon]|jgi:flagellar protein FlaJ|nr:type II secretion system F family protein [Methanomicrobiales archaeon]